MYIYVELILQVDIETKKKKKKLTKINMKNNK